MEVHSQIYAMVTLHFEKEPLHRLLAAGQAAEAGLHTCDKIKITYPCQDIKPLFLG